MSATSFTKKPRNAALKDGEFGTEACLEMRLELCGGYSTLDEFLSATCGEGQLFSGQGAS
jgi:hypothetical protein